MLIAFSHVLSSGWVGPAEEKIGTTPQRPKEAAAVSKPGGGPEALSIELRLGPVLARHRFAKRASHVNKIQRSVFRWSPDY